VSRDGARKRDLIVRRGSIKVDRPAATVFAYLTDPANIPEWSWIRADVERPVAGAGIQVGTTLHARVRAFGLNVIFEGHVIEFDREARVAAIRSEFPGGGWIESGLRVDDHAGCSAVHFVQRFALPRWAQIDGLVLRALSHLLIARVVEGATECSLSNLKCILEHGPYANGPETREGVWVGEERRDQVARRSKSA
jgi:polyketide cyclase/dehydrase/lipid transport protein